MASKVSLVRCQSYDDKEVYIAVKQALDLLGGIAAFIKPGQKVLLKPNMLGTYPPEKGVTTHPSILSAVIKLVRDCGGLPFVGDSPGFDDAEKSFALCGYKKVCEENNIPYVIFAIPQEVKIPDGIRFKSLKIAKEALDADIIINLPKLKTHHLTGITCAVKNMFGCIPGLMKSEYHLKIPGQEDFCLLLLDLLQAVKPTLTVVDAVVAMQGEGGPVGGELINLNLISASNDPIALDRVICQVIGEDPMKITTNKIAMDHAISPKEIEILGEKVENVACKDFKKILMLPKGTFPGPLVIQNYLSKILSEKPTLIESKCIHCKICQKVCQSKAISFPINIPIYNYDKCIKCFCCLEMCPEKAIVAKRDKIGQLLIKFAGFILGLKTKIKSVLSKS